MAKNNDDFSYLKKLIEEINKALNDENMINFENRQINEVMSGAAGAATGAVIGTTGLIVGGTTGLSAAGITSGLATAGALVGGGMVAGIAVLAAPAVLLGAGGVLIASKINKDKIKNQNVMLLKECLVKLRALYNEIKSTSKKNQERISYLTQLASELRRCFDVLSEGLDKSNFDIGQLPLLDETLESQKDKNIEDTEKEEDTEKKENNENNSADKD